MEMPELVQRYMDVQLQALLARLDEVVLCLQAVDFGVPSD